LNHEVDMDLERERQRLFQRDAEWAALSSEGRDVQRILSFWTDDARVYPPGLPVQTGKTALRNYVEGALAIPGFHITWTSSDAILSPDGQLGYLLSANVVTMPGPDGRLVTTRGRGLTVWRREPDGEWRCAVDIWNDEPAAI
jgi:ketosteroid isomerase-like protein